MTTATLDKPQTAKSKPAAPSGPTWIVDAAAMTALLRAVDPATTCTLDTYRDKVLLSVEDGLLTAYADNLIVGILARGPMVDTPFPPVVVAHGQLSALVGRLSGPVEFRVTDKGIDVTAPSTRATVRMLGDVEDMPLMPPETVEPAFTIHADTVARAIGRTVHAAAKPDTGRPVLVGMFVDACDGALTFAAADGHALAAVHVAKLDITGWPETHVIIPATECRTLAKLLSSAPDGTKATVGFAAHGRVIIETPNWRMRIGTIDGTFPDYRLIVPMDFATTATANREVLTSAVRTAGLFAHDNIIHVAIDDGAITVRGSDADKGQATTSVPANVTGPPLTLKLDTRYVGNVLAIAEGDDLTLCANSASQAAIIRDAYSKDAFVVMPIVT